MMKVRGLLTEKRLKEVYRPLCRWTDWWMSDRDADGDGLPEYHHGNDSGWDNGDDLRRRLPGHLARPARLPVVQMDVLADLATRLGRERDA